MTIVLESPAPDLRPDTAVTQEPVTEPLEIITTANGQDDAPDAAEDTGIPDEGLRPLTGDDFLVSAAWGIAGALATTAVSVLFVPVHLMALTFILGAGLGVLGYLDHCTRLIRNTHSLVFGIAAALVLGATQIVSGGAVLLPALVAAVAAFGFMLALTVVTGFAGGGDIKLSPIPAALLAGVSPLAAMLWLLFTFTLCLVGMIAARLAGSKRKHVAMAPFMAVAAVLALGVYGILSQVLGV